MTKFYTVTLPVKPYIKKYVETIEGDLIQFRGKSMLCQIVRAYMLNKNSTGLSVTKKTDYIAQRSSSLTIQVPIAYMHTVGVAIADDGILLINAFLHSCFERAAHQYVKENTRQDGRYRGYKAALEEFATTFGLQLEEDITYDGLKKMEWRHRSRNTTLFSEIVPSL